MAHVVDPTLARRAGPPPPLPLPLPLPPPPPPPPPPPKMPPRLMKL